MKKRMLKSRTRQRTYNAGITVGPTVGSPTRNMNNTRTKIDFQIAKTWNDVPVVIIRRLLEQSPVFKALTDVSICFNPKKTYREIKKAFAASNDYSITCPRYIDINFTYQKQDAHITVRWWDDATRWEILLTKPSLTKYYPNGNHNSAKRFGSKFAGACVEKIEDAINEALPEMAETAKDRAITDTISKARVTFRKDLSEVLQQDFYEDPNAYGNINSFMIKRGKTFDFTFRLKTIIQSSKLIADPEKELYTITGLGGAYTLDDIRILIKVVCVNPRAIAERLIHG
jgi:hypothetical protein